MCVFLYEYHFKLCDDLCRFSVRWPKNAQKIPESCREVTAVCCSSEDSWRNSRREVRRSWRRKDFFASGWGVEVEASIPSFFSYSCLKSKACKAKVEVTVDRLFHFHARFGDHFGAWKFGSGPEMVPFNLLKLPHIGGWKCWRSEFGAQGIIDKESKIITEKLRSFQEFQLPSLPCWLLK